MAAEYMLGERNPFGDERVQTGSMACDCLYLGGMVRAMPDGSGGRISGLGEPYCIMMRRLPCPENCPDRKGRG